MRKDVLFCALAFVATFAVAQTSNPVNADVSVTLKHMQSRDCAIQIGALGRAQELLASDETDEQDKGHLRGGLIQMLNGENARLQSRSDPKLKHYGRPSACPGGDGDPADEDDPPEVKFYLELVATVAQFDDERAIPALVGAIYVPDADEGLMKYGDKALGPVLELLRSPDEGTRQTSLRVSVGLLEKHKEPDSRVKIRELILSALADSSSIIRTQAVKEISCLGDRQEYVPMLEQVAKTDPLKFPGKALDGGDVDGFYPVRAHARQALREIRNGEKCTR